MTRQGVNGDPLLLPSDGLGALFAALERRGYTIVGPKVDQGAIIYGELRSAGDLPRGWSEEQSPGSYRLVAGDPDRYFAFTVGPHSWKQFLFPPRATVAVADRTEAGWQLRDPDEPVPRYALLGVRACELAALAVQDRTFLGDQYSDPIYRQRREAALIVAVNCTQAASTCFCTSMGTGPRCRSGFDLGLTEIAAGFVLEIGSERGEEIVADLPTQPVVVGELEAAAVARQRAVDQITRRLDTDGIRDLLLNNLNHPRWDQVAERCLSCTNCTMVCPTCFCSSVHEVADLTGDHVERERQWDSCFNLELSYQNAGIIRNSIRSRYRQWLTHKLASWIDQFDVSGCVGCGRCISWCPVGIDLTEEVAAIRESPG